MSRNLPPKYELTMRVKQGTEWVDYNLRLLEGKSARQINQEFDGQDAVAKIVICGNNCFLCGTEDLKKRMIKKGGKAVTFAEATELMDRIAPEFLERIVEPILTCGITSVFDYPVIKYEE